MLCNDSFILLHQLEAHSLTVSSRYHSLATQASIILSHLQSDWRICTPGGRDRSFLTDDFSTFYPTLSRKKKKKKKKARGRRNLLTVCGVNLCTGTQYSYRSIRISTSVWQPVIGWIFYLPKDLLSWHILLFFFFFSLGLTPRATGIAKKRPKELVGALTPIIA